MGPPRRCRPLLQIETPGKKCRHCGHCVVKPHDTVCLNRYMPHGQADRIASTAIRWLGVGALVVVFLFLWPDLPHIEMEIID